MTVKKIMRSTLCITLIIFHYNTNRFLLKSIGKYKVNEIVPVICILTTMKVFLNYLR